MEPETSQPKLTKKRLWLGIASGVVAIAAIASGIYFGMDDATKTIVTPESTATATVTATAAPTPTPVATVAPVTDAGVTWLAAPEKVADLGLVKAVDIKNYSFGEVESTLYYKVGSDNGKDIVVMVGRYKEYGPGLAEGELQFVADGKGKYQFLSAHSGVKDSYANANTYYGFALTDKVSGTSDKVYASVAPQATLAVKGITVKAARSKGYGHWFATLEAAAPTVTSTNPKIKEYATTPYGQVYTVTTTPADTGYSVQFFLLKHFNGMSAAFDLNPAFMKDDGVAMITWNDGVANKDTYKYGFVGGCGFPYGVAIVDNVKSTDLVAAGKTNANETVYDFVDQNHKTVQVYYNAYAKANQSAISLTEYMKHHGVFVYKDALGRNVVFISTTYGYDAECGGPFYGVF